MNNDEFLFHIPREGIDLSDFEGALRLMLTNLKRGVSLAKISEQSGVPIHCINHIINTQANCDSNASRKIALAEFLTGMKAFGENPSDKIEKLKNEI